MPNHKVITRLFAAMAVLTSVAQVPADQPVDLKIKFAKNQQSCVTVAIENDGNVIVIADEEKAEAKALPLRVLGKLKYYQRPTSNQQAIRYFDQAEANIRLEQGKTEPSLSPSNRLIIVRYKSDRAGLAEMASVTDVLAQQELELIQTPADPLTLPNLFAKKKVKVGQQWDPSPVHLAQFLAVDEIVSSDVQLTLKRIDNNQARVFLAGTVLANVHDVTTEMKVNGVAMIDTIKHQIRSLKVGIDEARPVGQINPGFEGRTRIELAFDYDQSTDRLSNASLAKVVRSKKIQQRLKYEADGAFRISYDPRWKLIAGEEDTALMRFIDKGELLTQCNVVLLPARPASQPLTLEKFKDELGKVIGEDKDARLLAADSETTANGLTALSVVVAGVEDELPVNWFYYHVAHKDGRQVTFVFTLAESVSGRVKGVANQLVNEFQFLGQPAKVSRQENRTTGAKR